MRPAAFLYALELLMAGALDNPLGALLVFRADSTEVVESFARADPYVARKLVKSWQIRPWTVAVGGDAT
jgi:uncharacterized protein YciI